MYSASRLRIKTPPAAFLLASRDLAVKILLSV
jgi:hypothetical protein